MVSISILHVQIEGVLCVKAIYTEYDSLFTVPKRATKGPGTTSKCSQLKYKDIVELKTFGYSGFTHPSSLSYTSTLAILSP